MIVSWNHVPVSEAKGIIVSYRVSYYAISDDERETMVRNDLAVPGSDSSVLIGDLSPSKSYQVSVLASTLAGDGTDDVKPAIAVTGTVRAQCHFQCAVDYCIFIFGTSLKSLFNCCRISINVFFLNIHAFTLLNVIFCIIMCSNISMCFR